MIIIVLNLIYLFYRKLKGLFIAITILLNLKGFQNLINLKIIAH